MGDVPSCPLRLRKIPKSSRVERLQSESSNDESTDESNGAGTEASVGARVRDGGGSGRLGLDNLDLGGLDGDGLGLDGGGLDVGRGGVLNGRRSRSGSRDNGRSDDAGAGGGLLAVASRKSDGLLAVALADSGGLVGGAVGTLGLDDVEGVGVLEDVGVALVLDDEAVELGVTEGSIDSPGVLLSGVGDASGNVSQRLLGVLGLTTDQVKRDGTLSVVLGSRPDNLEGLASGELGVGLGLGDGVETLGLGHDGGSEGRKGGEGESELHFGGVGVWLLDCCVEAIQESERKIQVY
jgi:hypothetical protein